MTCHLPKVLLAIVGMPALAAQPPSEDRNLRLGLALAPTLPRAASFFHTALNGAITFVAPSAAIGVLP